jgi:hypothetical protein
VVITQAVEHQHDQLPSSRDDPDVAATPLADPVPGAPEPGVRADALHRLDRGPPDQGRALLICGNPDVNSLVAQ